MTTTTQTITAPDARQTTPQEFSMPRTAPLRPPRSRSSSRDSTENVTAQPYEKQLMAEPPPDLNVVEERKLEIRYHNYILFRGKRNKDWRSILAVDTETFDEPLSPLCERNE